MKVKVQLYCCSHRQRGSVDGRRRLSVGHMIGSRRRSLPASGAASSARRAEIQLVCLRWQGRLHFVVPRPRVFLAALADRETDAVLLPATSILRFALHVYVPRESSARLDRQLCQKDPALRLVGDLIHKQTELLPPHSCCKRRRGSGRSVQEPMLWVCYAVKGRLAYARFCS